MNNNSYRQELHLEPPQGWMNDPNGLSYFDNKYHVYFQYSPFDAEGSGDRGWGHFESTNLVNWTYTGMVIRPDMPADKDGAYSGSAIVCGDSLEIFIPVMCWRTETTTIPPPAEAPMSSTYPRRTATP